jgi:hypothetical protein
MANQPNLFEEADRLAAERTAAKATTTLHTKVAKAIREDEIGVMGWENAMSSSVNVTFSQFAEWRVPLSVRIRPDLDDPQ